MSLPHSLRRAMSVLGLVLLCAAAADAQIRPIQDYQPTTSRIRNAQPSDGPFLPVRPNEPPATGIYTEPEFVPYVNDLQMFDQPDLSAYGRGPRPTEGWFGSAEVLQWAIQAPPKSTIGSATPQEVYAIGARTVNTGVAPTNANVIAFGFTGPPSDVVNMPRRFLNGSVFQTSALDTGFLESEFTSGSRFEFGRINDGRGWIVSSLHLGTQTQAFESRNAAVNFDDGPFGFVDVESGDPNTTVIGGDGFDDDLDGDNIYGRDGGDRGTGTTTFTSPLDGIPDPQPSNTPRLQPDFDDAVPLPTVFQRLQVENRTSMYGVEAMRMWRVALGPRGGIWELFLGPRYINVKDQFNVRTEGPNTNPAYILNSIADTNWNTDTENSVFGLQFGGRWAIQRDRWQFSMESRILAAANFQNAHQVGQMGTLYLTTVTGSTIVFRDNLLLEQQPRSIQSSMSTVVFSPGGELRANLKYQLFRSVYLQLGYTALYMKNIARANSMVRYRYPDLGIKEEANRQNFFVNGVDFGIVINR